MNSAPGGLLSRVPFCLGTSMQTLAETSPIHEWLSTVLAVGAALISLVNGYGVFVLAKAKVDDHAKRIPRVEKDLATINIDLNTLQSDNESLKKDVSRLEGQLEEARRSNTGDRERLVRIETKLEIVLDTVEKMNSNKR